MVSIIEDTAAYEAWLATQCKVVASALDRKHEVMRKSPFRFLRATYFRWARTSPQFAGHLADAPLALCVGDAHVENFGTWIDADGRRVWGANDFDEAAVMPYVLDLIRLLVSARLASEIEVDAPLAARAILAGYKQGLKAPRPVLLEQDAAWFRQTLASLEDKTDKFWSEMADHPAAVPPEPVRLALLHALPHGAQNIRYATRQNGGGGLGRPRFLSIADWRGGKVVREAKALVPSAWDWASGSGGASRFMEVAEGAYRSPDSSITRAGNFIIRRIAPDARKLDLEDVAKDGRGSALLEAMAADLAAIHVASASVKRIQKDLARRPGGWLASAASKAEEIVRADHQAWKAHRPRKGRA